MRGRRGGAGLLRARAPATALALVLGVLALGARGSGGAGDEGAGGAAGARKQAFVSLLTGEEYALGLRVLGESLRSLARTQRCAVRGGARRRRRPSRRAVVHATPPPKKNACSDLVALVTGDVSETTAATLVTDGWRVVRVEPLLNPGTWTQQQGQGHAFPPRFWAVYTKVGGGGGGGGQQQQPQRQTCAHALLHARPPLPQLHIWGLTEYESIVYLDADTIVTRPLDELFLCDGVCGVMRASERLNTGVLVVQPNATLFQQLLDAMPTTPSYTGAQPA